MTTAACLPPEWGANAVLRPWRKPLSQNARLPKEDVAFRGEGDALLKGWLFRAKGRSRGLLVFLHGVGDNRAAGLGVAERFVGKGLDVLVYDSRAQGESEGEVCTYGYLEKRDLIKALDAVGTRSAVAFGSSLGGAVALQAAPLDPRIRGVIAQSSYADLETIVRDRSPFFASQAEIRKALALVERNGRFPVAQVSPEKAASAIRVPVLLLHGDKDRDTPPRHSQRILAGLAGPKALMLVPGAGHNDVFGREEAWRAVERFVAALPLD